MIRIGRLFSALDRLDSQWVAAGLLSAFAATFVFAVVLSAATKPVVERSKTRLLDLQLSGAHPYLSWAPGGTRPTDVLLEEWTKTGAFGYARRAQWLDVPFAAAYGAFFLLLAVAVRRLHPQWPDGGLWVWAIAFGALAALLDEAENVLLLWILSAPGEPAGSVVPVL